MKTLIIAEAGVNHNGNLDIAKKLIDVASNAKVDFIKFQTYKTKNLVSSNAKMADYQIKNTSSNLSQFEMLKNLELSFSDFQELISYSKNKKIGFLSSPFDIESIDYLNKLEIDFIKIPSGEITNFPYLEKIASISKKVILSTGMSTLKEIESALDILTSKNLKKKDITLLHCNTEYPTPFVDVNLKAMENLKNHFDMMVGYSDHTLGIEVPIAAVALGACVIEKHITLDSKMEGPDHFASIEPKQLDSMVKSIRNIETAISGSGIKTPSNSELKNINIARKSIFTNCKIERGTVIEKKHLTTLRPGDGISPMNWNKIVGKTVNKKLPIFHKLNWNDIKDK
jgi:N,N'-diacetyllegionaminate synthase